MSRQTKYKEILYVAFDVEKKGSGPNYPVIQVGVAWGTCPSDMQSRSFCFDYNDRDFEKRCYEEFWKKNMKVLQRIENESVEPKRGWLEFVRLIDGFEAPDRKIVLLSDNPAYDISAIDHHIVVEQKLRAFGLQNSRDGAIYRSINDPTEQD